MSQYQLPIVGVSKSEEKRLLLSGFVPKTDFAKIKSNLEIVLRSFGVKSGKDFPSADTYIDCRGIPDPSHYTSGNGDDPAVQQWVKEKIDLGLYYELVMQHFSMLTLRKGQGNEFDKPFIILCMCAHGIHRSRALKNLLAASLKGNGYQKVKVE